MTTLVAICLQARNIPEELHGVSVSISQNIQAKQSDLRSQLDYEVNVKAEQEVEEIRSLLLELKQNQEIPKAKLG